MQNEPHKKPKSSLSILLILIILAVGVFFGRVLYDRMVGSAHQSGGNGGPTPALPHQPSDPTSIPIPGRKDPASTQPQVDNGSMEPERARSAVKKVQNSVPTESDSSPAPKGTVFFDEKE